MNKTTCRVDDCDKPIKRKDLCYSHYMKDWRYGTPTPEHPRRHQALEGRRFGTLVVHERVGILWRCACDCGAETHVRSGDLNRGTVATCGDKAIHWRKDDVGYGGAHGRVRADRGPASTHPCELGCGRPAYHWSYDHADPDELRDDSLGVYYSTKVEHYRPLCVPCHKRFDLDYLAEARGGNHGARSLRSPLGTPQG